MRNNKPCKRKYTQSWQGILSNDVNQQMITRVHSQSPKQTWTRIFGNQPSPPRCWLSWWKRVRDWNFQVQPGACKKSGEGEGLKWAMRHGVWPILPSMILKLSRMSWAHKVKYISIKNGKKHWMRTAFPKRLSIFHFRYRMYLENLLMARFSSPHYTVIMVAFWHFEPCNLHHAMMPWWGEKGFGSWQGACSEYMWVY